MSKPIIDIIAAYAKSYARNKIVLFRENIPGIEPINVSFLLSEAIFNLKETDKFSLRASRILEAILQNAISTHPLYGKMLAIENIGILFEPELKIDFTLLLDRYSQNNALFVQWKGEIDREHLYFLTKEHGIKINIKNLSHIVLWSTETY